MKVESSIVGPAVKEGVEGMNSESAAINRTRKSQISGTKLKRLYARVPQILAPALLVIGVGAYAQQSSDNPVISLSTVSKLDRSQAGIYRTKTAKIDLITVSHVPSVLAPPKQLLQNPTPAP